MKTEKVFYNYIGISCGHQSYRSQKMVPHCKYRAISQLTFFAEQEIIILLLKICGFVKINSTVHEENGNQNCDGQVQQRKHESNQTVVLGEVNGWLVYRGSFLFS